jgi:hypothetical protein
METGLTVASPLASAGRFADRADRAERDRTRPLAETLAIVHVRRRLVANVHEPGATAGRTTLDWPLSVRILRWARSVSGACFRRWALILDKQSRWR